MRIRRIANSTPNLISVMRVERSLLKSASGGNKFKSVLDRMSMKLQSKLGDFMCVKTKFSNGLQCARGIDDLAHI
eukprot:scaffold152357_cov22-Tisochrysis_lutea.AAC.1